MQQVSLLDEYDTELFLDKSFESPLDEGIKFTVVLLLKPTCEGRCEHSYPEPTIRFQEECSEGFRVLAIALQHAFPVDSIRRVCNIIDGEPTGPTEMVFYERVYFA